MAGPKLTLALLEEYVDVEEEDEEEDDVVLIDTEEDDEEVVETEEEDEEVGELDCELLLELLELDELVLVVTVETEVRVAKYAPPASITIITTTTTIRIARETPLLLIEIECKIIFLRLEDRYIRIATVRALEFLANFHNVRNPLESTMIGLFPPNQTMDSSIFFDKESTWKQKFRANEK